MLSASATPAPCLLAQSAVLAFIGIMYMAKSQLSIVYTLQFGPVICAGRFTIGHGLHRDAGRSSDWIDG
ncbi:hypothetical protein LX36DRAFT_656283 [Colletotrichum falcatum]|nr:hypothetical protein LX36DRAFT_656283 [Colletotrichum falcatum]